MIPEKTIIRLSHFTQENGNSKYLVGAYLEPSHSILAEIFPDSPMRKIVVV